MTHPLSEERSADPNLAAPLRSHDVDVLRGFALLGIMVVNAPYFAFPVSHVPVPTTLLDAAALWINNSLFAGKFFLMFSFLFGFGFARILKSGAGDPIALRSRFFRRLLALFAFGLLHAVFLFYGDILMLYALLGVLLWLCREKTTQTLLVAAGAIYALAVIAQVVAIQEALIQATATTPAAQIVAGQGYLGSFTEAAAQRIRDLPTALGFVLLFNGLPAMAMFLVGLVAGRTGSFPPSRETLIRLKGRVRFALLAGFIGSSTAFLSVLTLSGSLQDARSATMIVSLICFSICAPVLSFGLAITVLIWAQAAGRSTLANWLTVAGRSSLSGYILQSVIFGALFMGWGFGFFGSLQSAAILVIAFLAFGATLLILYLWSLWFRYGPDEWLLRSFVDLKWKPIWNPPNGKTK